MARKDDLTAELPGVPRRRGRPPGAKAKSGSERMREYRLRKAAEGREALSILLDEEVLSALRGYVDRKNRDVAVQPITLSDAVELILRDRLLRKR